MPADELLHERGRQDVGRSGNGMDAGQQAPVLRREAR